MVIQKNDCVELHYTGTISSDGTVFDTTEERVSKEHHLENVSGKPVVICVCQGFLPKGVEDLLIGKDVGEYTFPLPPERAFGKKNAKLITLIPTNKFMEQKIRPVPNLSVNIDGMVGIIKSVSGGRTIVDFNHPLANKDVTYVISVKRILTDAQEKVTAILTRVFGLRGFVVKKEGAAFNVSIPHEFPEHVSKYVVEKVKDLTGQDVKFSSATSAEHAAAHVAPAAPAAPKVPSSDSSSHAGHNHGNFSASKK